MSSMMQPILGLISGAARSSAAAAGVKELSRAQLPEAEAPVRSTNPVRDEYVPEEKQEATGRYWLGKDENGRPKIYVDDPERVTDEGKKNSEPSDTHGPAGKAAGDKTERCTGSTDQVDREIERLKKKKKELEQQISAQTDEGRIKELEQKLAQVERELSQKDNDTYRRQHTVFS